jgi:hypothetical protein
MIPFSYEMVKDLPNAHVSSLFLASAHISIYVADVQVIELPLWAKLLKIVQVVLFVMALLGAVGIREIMTAIIKEVLKNYIMKQIMQALMKYDPKLALIVAVAYGVYQSGGSLLELFNGPVMDLVTFLSDIANQLGSSMTAYAYEEDQNLTEKEKKQKVLNDKQMEPLREAQESMLVDSNGNALALIGVSVTSTVNPVSAEQFYLNTVENYNLIGYDTLNIDNTYANLYEPITMAT